MIATGQFAGDPKAQQRLVYTDRAAGFSIPVDLIPFRGVASANKMIAWPPSRDVVLNVAGFKEAWASSLQVAVEEGLPVSKCARLISPFEWDYSASALCTP